MTKIKTKTKTKTKIKNKNKNKNKNKIFFRLKKIKKKVHKYKYNLILIIKMPKEITSLNEFNAYASQLAIVDFYAPWCGPCKNIAPIFEKLSLDPKHKSVHFLKVNVDENDDIANKYGVQSLPTFMTFKNGKPVGMFKGASSDHLVNLLNNLLKA